MFELYLLAIAFYLLIAWRSRAPIVRHRCSTPGLIDVQEDGGVRTVTLEDTKTRNALSLHMLSSLYSAIHSPGQESLRCIVLKAKGNVFSAGHNLKEIHSGDVELHSKLFTKCSELMLSLQELPVPIIAQVNGLATAAGCQLVASCDIVVASETSSFSTPGASRGLFCSTPGIPLVRCVPRKVSAYMLLTGLPIDAHTALQAGLVSRVVPEHLLEHTTATIVSSIVSKSKPVLALGKRFMYRQMEMTEQQAYQEGGEIMIRNINMNDGQEGITSFVEKRHPKWHSEEGVHQRKPTNSRYDDSD